MESKLLINWSMPIKDKLIFILIAFLLGICVGVAGILIAIFLFNKSISIIIVGALFILIGVCSIFVLINRRVKIYTDKTVYYNAFGFKKTLVGDINEATVYISNKNHDRMYLTMKYGKDSDSLPCRIVYSEDLVNLLKMFKIKHVVMLK